MTTWDDVRAAEAAEQAAREAYDESPSDAASLAWEAARDSLDRTLRAYKASRSNRQAPGGDR